MAPRWGAIPISTVRRRLKLNRKLIDKLSLGLVATAIMVLALLNVFQTDRPTVSESENRNLAAWPEFKIADVASGKYFSDIGAFFSDTFFQRDALVNFSKELDQLKGLFDDDFSVIIHPDPVTPSDPADGTLPTLPPLTKPTEPSTVPSEPSVPGTEPSVPPVIPIALSSNKVSLTVGTSHMLTATVGDDYGSLTWSTDNTKLVSVTDNGDGTATVKALAAGTASVSATVADAAGQQVSCLCVFTISAPPQTNTGGDVDFVPDSSMFIYNGAAYTQSNYTSKVTPKLAQIYDRFAQLFPDTRVSVMVAPLSSIIITDSNVNKQIQDQGAILDKIEKAMPDSIHYINLKDTFKAHRDEYLFFKSDHHWTQRGAYYAYQEFALSVGLTPRPIEDFEVKVLTETWIGSMYRYTKDERVKEFKDTIEAYIPSKACTMTIINNGEEWHYKYCINTGRSNYLAFLNGDWGYTVINVPENPQDKTIIVIKDSYGNALVPFLTEHYGNIIVIDPRHVELDALESFGGMQISDILFINNTSSMSTTFYNHYIKMVD